MKQTRIIIPMISLIAMLVVISLGIPNTVSADSSKPCENSEDPVVHEGVNNRACAENSSEEPDPDFNGAFNSESDVAEDGIYFRPNCIHTETTQGSESCDKSSDLDN